MPWMQYHWEHVTVSGETRKSADPTRISCRVWIPPVLVVLCRARPQERLLVNCKTRTETPSPPQWADFGCVGGNIQGCGECVIIVNS